MMIQRMLVLSFMFLMMYNKTWDFDEQQLSTNKIWFDVNTKTYLTVTLDKDGKKVANYHTTPDEARKFLENS